MSVESHSALIVVVGGGHAGVEAALASARLGCKTALVTHDEVSIARMSCNPALGGLGKGHLIKEVDALGGQMASIGDQTGIHFRRLNTRKGAAVRGTRCQSDRQSYSRLMQRTLREQPHLELIFEEARKLVIRGGRVVGLALESGRVLKSSAVILTTGTFLAAQMHIGSRTMRGGRIGGRAAFALGESLADSGLPVGRLKTGTPCRLDARSLDYSRMEPQPGDQPAPRLSSFGGWPSGKPPLPQVHCHITYTNPRTHEVIRENIEQSAIFSGAITSSGPRYCPSIEDKLVRFADRERHQIFVEPEGLCTLSVYPNGISTSLPAEVQQRFIRTIAGFENARIMRPGYAVEYGYVDPTVLEKSLEVRALPGLYLAGQINGTTGYEEAAAQGLMAGINAARASQQKEPIILRRDQAYIGVLIDDLVTKGVGHEPYRMFTSRAEYRLLLREDNATERLTPLARELGLIDDQRWAFFSDRHQRADKLRGRLLSLKAPSKQPSKLDELLEDAGSVAARPGMALAELLRRPQVTIELLTRAGLVEPEDSEVVERVEVELKYAPYIERQEQDAQLLEDLEQHTIPEGFDYQSIPGLSNEVREKLEKRQPGSLAQAGRIPGITPAAIAILQFQLRLRAAPRRRQPPRPKAASA
jgi:tRNA uridine 5-carboxymethylaminomethyl modification enzyme